MGSDGPFTQEQVTPTDLKLKRDAQVLVVTWQDGHVSTFDAMTLRKNCPCATCNTDRQRQSQRAELFPILKSDPGRGPPKAIGAELVGNYAIRLQWSDRHDTGIYDFRFLRSLDTGQRG